MALPPQSRRGRRSPSSPARSTRTGTPEQNGCAVILAAGPSSRSLTVPTRARVSSGCAAATARRRGSSTRPDDGGAFPVAFLSPLFFLDVREAIFFDFL